MCGTSAEHQRIYLEIWVENSGRDKTHLDKPKRIFFYQKIPVQNYWMQKMEP